MLADFLTGLIHWWEDRFLDLPRSKILAAIELDNYVHHINPEAMGKLSAWENIKEHAWAGWTLALVSWYLGAPLWLWLAFFFASFGNLVHRWAHVPRSKVPTVVRWIQRTGLMITASHHAGHHREGRTLVMKDQSYRRFCPMTNWVNPVLDSIGFFPRLERTIRHCLRRLVFLGSKSPLNIDRE